jgi:hypothetical protein
MDLHDGNFLGSARWSTTTWALRENHQEGVVLDGVDSAVKRSVQLERTVLQGTNVDDFPCFSGDHPG